MPGRDAIRREILDATQRDLWRACLPVKFQTAFRESLVNAIINRALDAWSIEIESHALKC